MMKHPKNNNAFPGGVFYDGFDPDMNQDEILKKSGVITFTWSKKTDLLKASALLSVLFPLVNDFDNIRSGRELLAYLLPNDRIRLIQTLKVTLSGSPVFSDFRLVTKTGEELWINVSFLCAASGENIFISGVAKNVTSYRRRLSDAARLAYTDNLTGLINRSKLKQKLALALSGALEYNLKFGFFVLSIDNLTAINENFGYDIADTLITGIGDKLVNALRSTDVVARIASARFGILLTDHNVSFIGNTGKRLLNLISNSVFETRSGVITATVSGGGCMIPDDGLTVEAIINAAEESLAVAKSYGRDNFVHYNAAYERTETRRKNINTARDVVSAVRESRILAAFQPIVRSDNFKPAFYECLARIRKPDGSVVPGGAFIEVAENIGFIRMIDRRIYEIAIEKLHQYPDLKLSVNISGHTVSDTRSSEYLRSLLRDNASVAPRLIVEITETIAMQDMRDAAFFIHSLKEIGCKVALDDFGAGYTSFYNLKTFPFDMVKLDGVYIRDLIDSPKNGKFIKALADLASSLEMECVAEMVSSKEISDVLTEYNIQYYQGFYYGMPEINPDFNADLKDGVKNKLSR